MRVRGPHAREHLANAMHGIFHGARLDRFVAGSDFSGAVVLGKDLAEGNGVIGGREQRVESEADIEC